MPAHTLAPIAAGVAAAQACGDEVRLKWPNDLLLGGRKLGGILVERIGQKCVVGTGINLHWAPPGAARLNVDRDELLVRMEREMPHWFGASGAEVCDAWRQRSDTLGRLVRVELPGETFEGIAQDLGSDGSLIVGGRRVTAGDVIHLQEADSRFG
jgi:BirA family biotin operon repressor/biotin-[acetyl-CoA-carboxylase] ligase